MSLRALLAASLGLVTLPVREELVLERRFALEFELATTAFELRASEGERTEEQRPPAVRRSESQLLEATDRADDAADPLARFARTYETVSSAFSFGGGAREPDEEVVTAGLEGRTVTFEREGEDEWSRASDGEGINERQLARLRADLALAVFLPPEGHAADEPWELGYAPFERLIGPLGPVGARQRRRTPGAGGGLDLAPSGLVEPLWLLLARAEGTATFTPAEPDDEAELPRLATFEFRFEASHDGAKHLVRGREAEVEDEVELVWEGTGTLAWDPASGAIELALVGELELEEEFRVSFTANGATAELEGTLACNGPLELEARERRAE